MKNIRYRESAGKFNTAFKTTAPSLTGGTGPNGGKLDGAKPSGGQYELTDFPLRRHENTENYSTLFLGISGTITDLIVTHSISSPYDLVVNDLNYSVFGIISATFIGEALIERCTVNGNLVIAGSSGTHIGGGMVGTFFDPNFTGIIKFDSAVSNLSISSIGPNVYYGGLGGYFLGEGIGSVNTANHYSKMLVIAANCLVTGQLGMEGVRLKRVGGLFAQVFASLDIRGCEFNGSMRVQGDFSGGLIARVSIENGSNGTHEKCYINGCTFRGRIVGYVVAGSMVGIAQLRRNGFDIQFNNNNNYGTLEGVQSTFSGAAIGNLRLNVDIIAHSDTFIEGERNIGTYDGPGRITFVNP